METVGERIGAAMRHETLKTRVAYDGCRSFERRKDGKAK
jgi:hypothetical protein